MNKKNIFIIFYCFLIAGCQTIQLSPEGQKVRTVSPVVAQNCELLGLESAFASALEGGLKPAQIELRNKIAANGGNAMLLISQQVDEYGNADLTAETYRCVFN